MNTRCCARCRAVPGACARKWDCQCHTDDRRDRHDTFTDWELAVKQALAKQSREEAKRISDFAPWR